MLVGGDRGGGRAEGGGGRRGGAHLTQVSFNYC